MADLRPARAQQQPSVRSADHDLPAERQDRRRSAGHRSSQHRQGLRLLSPEVEARHHHCWASTQSAFQGTPIDTCLPVVGTASACQWAEGRGNFVQLVRAANGDIVEGRRRQGCPHRPLHPDRSLHPPRDSGARRDAPGVRSQRAQRASITGSVHGVAENILATGLVSPTRARASPAIRRSIGAR